ncbi:outer membrane protein [Luteimonas colneyensis]|uniref:outer membrane protein n=1 Tax=Luteimonas colneyensis TaxID=2762230 RepID=UPI001CD911D4|nr:porin family protein [Luteimonas colneyensis]
MKYSRQAAATAAFIVAAMAASASASAQTRPVEAWQPPARQEPDPAKRIPAPVETAPTATAAQAAPAAATAAQVAPAVHVDAPPAAVQDAGYAYEEGRGGFFLGAKGGRGWVYDDIDQSARELNAGYRWQAGSVTLVGIELARGELGAASEGGFEVAEVDYGSIGVNARFNFGRSSPVYALVRAGYWSAEEKGDYGMDVDGGYFGLGLGVDINRHVNLGLTYTNYVYFDSYYWGDGYYEVNRADTLMFGAEVRF